MGVEEQATFRRQAASATSNFLPLLRSRLTLFRSAATVFTPPIPLGGIRLRNHLTVIRHLDGAHIRWSTVVALTAMATSMIDGLHAVGMDLAAARETLAAQTAIARNAAQVAAAAGVSERRIAAELGVARSKTVRRWLGKM